MKNLFFLVFYPNFWEIVQHKMFAHGVIFQIHSKYYILNEWKLREKNGKIGAFTLFYILIILPPWNMALILKVYSDEKIVNSLSFQIEVEYYYLRVIDFLASIITPRSPKSKIGSTKIFASLWIAVFTIWLLFQ